MRSRILLRSVTLMLGLIAPAGAKALDQPVPMPVPAPKPAGVPEKLPAPGAVEAGSGAVEPAQPPTQTTEPSPPIADPFRAASSYNPTRVNRPVPLAENTMPNFVLSCDIPNMNTDPFIYPPSCLNRWWGCVTASWYGSCGLSGCGGSACGGSSCGSTGCGSWGFGGWAGLGWSLGGNSCGSCNSCSSFRPTCQPACQPTCKPACAPTCQPACGAAFKACAATDINDQGQPLLPVAWFSKPYSGPSAEFACTGCSTFHQEARFIFGSCESFYNEPRRGFPPEPVNVPLAGFAPRIPSGVLTITAGR